MKRILAALAIAAFASSASALITNSKHDLSRMTGAVLGSCSYCHAPHLWVGTNVGVTTSNPPLWNRNSLARSAYQAWSTPYFVVVQPGTRSLTCLSCHDGQQDLGRVNNGAYASLGTIAAVANVGTDLRDDHPVGAQYVGGTGTELVDAATVRATLKLSYTGGQYYVECNSCHDPHETSLNAGRFFLRTEQKDLCSTCHLK